MNVAAAWLLAKPRSSRIAWLSLAVPVAVAAVVGLIVTKQERLAPLIGGAAGALLYGAGLLAWLTLLDDEQREHTNLKRRVLLPGRRYLAAGLAAAWVIVLLTFVTLLPKEVEPALGTVSVAVYLGLWMLVRRAPYDPAPVIVPPVDAADLEDGEYEYEIDAEAAYAVEDGYVDDYYYDAQGSLPEADGLVVYEADALVVYEADALVEQDLGEGALVAEGPGVGHVADHATLTEDEVASNQDVPAVPVSSVDGDQ